MTSVKKKNMRKTGKKQRKCVVITMIAFAILLLLSALLITYIYTQNYITVEKISKNKVTEATSVNSIIVNNIVIGGVTENGKFVDSDMAMTNNKMGEDTEIDMYNMEGKMGTYKVKAIGRIDSSNLLYVIPFKEVTNIEYMAISTGDKNIMQRKLVSLDKTDEDIKCVKKALGKYRLFNNTVKVNEVYEAYVTTDAKTKIICATSSGKNSFGVYSVIVAVKNGKCDIIKYAYVKNTQSSIKWPVYSLNFVCDLNGDDTYELILQETQELLVKYSVMEYRSGNFYEVIGTEVKI